MAWTEIIKEPEIAIELEEKGLLTPARGRKPRTVVGCRLSVGEKKPGAANNTADFDHDNGHGRL